MVTITIGGMSVPAEQASDAWIAQMLGEQQRRHVPACVQVSVQAPGIQVALATPACGGLGGGRQANERERPIIEAWLRSGLQQGRVTPHEVRSFLRDVARYV